MATLEGASETGFTAAGAPITFRLSCPTLKAGTDSVVVYDNGMPLPHTALVLTDNSVTLASGLAGGRHKVELVAQDVYGFTIEKGVVLWVGNRGIAVLVTDEAGAPVPGAIVAAKLSDDPKVTARLVTDAKGRGTFTNLPDRSYRIVATTADNRLATRPVSVSGGLVTIRLVGISGKR